MDNISSINLRIISFATKNWHQAHLRLNQQLKNFNFKMYNEDDLPDYYKIEFKDRFKDDGYAMWSWKPLIILNELQQLNDNDILLYVDGGCSFERLLTSKQLIDEFAKHINNMTKCKFPISVGYHPADIRNIIIQMKKEVVEKFNLSENFDFLKNWHHYEAGIFLVQKTVETVNFVKNWYLFMKDNYEQLFSGSRVDKTNQYFEYVANNGDQSVLQCMLYSYHKLDFYDIGSFWYKANVYTRIKK